MSRWAIVSWLLALGDDLFLPGDGFVFLRQDDVEARNHLMRGGKVIGKRGRSSHGHSESYFAANVAPLSRVYFHDASLGRR